MSELELANAALMRQYYEEVFNRRNPAFMREYWRAYDRHDLYETQLGGWRP